MVSSRTGYSWLDARRLMLGDAVAGQLGVQAAALSWVVADAMVLRCRFGDSDFQAVGREFPFIRLLSQVLQVITSVTSASGLYHSVVFFL